MISHKRFRTNSVFDHNLYPVPKLLGRSLDLISEKFYNSSMRNLDIMDTKEQRLYGFLTSYEENNYCWLQPTREMTKTADVDYDRYLRRINSDSNLGKLVSFHEEEIHVGLNCVAIYEADNSWYRAIVIDDRGVDEDKWSVLFIDYGNVQQCSSSQIKKPVEEMPIIDHYQAPLQAVCCRLYNIVPWHPDHRVKIDAYLEDFYAKHSNDFLEIIVKNKRQDYVVDCDVFYTRKATCGNRLYKKHIGQKLVDEGLAYFADPEAAHSLKPASSPSSEDLITIDDDDDDVKDTKSSIDVKPLVNMKGMFAGVPVFEKYSTDIKPNLRIKQEHS